MSESILWRGVSIVVAVVLSVMIHSDSTVNIDTPIVVETAKTVSYEINDLSIESLVTEQRERIVLKHKQDVAPVLVSRSGLIQQEPVAVSVTIPNKDVQLLARIVHAEAEGETFEGKVAIANVVMNRVKNNKFPNTVEGVIYQPNAFSPVTDGRFNNSPDQDSYNAVQRAITQGDNTGGALFFYNPSTAQDRWIRSRPIVSQIGNHVFTK